MQKVLICTTRTPSLRDTIIGWRHEDPKQVSLAYANHLHDVHLAGKYKYYEQNDIPVSLIGTSKFTKYSTPLHALGDDWQLIAPPQVYKEWEYGKQVDMWEWWLVATVITL